MAEMSDQALQDTCSRTEKARGDSLEENLSKTKGFNLNEKNMQNSNTLLEDKEHIKVKL